jgi:hypothetical protein
VHGVHGRARGRFIVPLSALVTFAALGAPHAGAVITVFTDCTRWQTAAAATGTIQNAAFESLATGTLPVGSNQLGPINLNIGLITATTKIGTVTYF